MRFARGGIQPETMRSGKRYRSAVEHALWLGMIESGLSPACDLSRVGLRARRHEWRAVLVISVALMVVASVIWLS